MLVSDNRVKILCRKSDWKFVKIEENCQELTIKIHNHNAPTHTTKHHPPILHRATQKTRPQPLVFSCAWRQTNRNCYKVKSFMFLLEWFKRIELNWKKFRMQRKSLSLHWKSARHERFNRYLMAASQSTNNPETTCEGCGKTYSSIAGLKQHIRRGCRRNQPNVCNHCPVPREFTTPNGLGAHLKNSHPEIYNTQNLDDWWGERVGDTWSSQFPQSSQGNHHLSHNCLSQKLWWHQETPRQRKLREVFTANNNNINRQWIFFNREWNQTNHPMITLPKQKQIHHLFHPSLFNPPY